jgi:hypothetical protein
MYSQTPNAFHMAGGYANPYDFRVTPFGTVFGTGANGDAASGFASRLPSYALTAGTAAAMAGAFMPSNMAGYNAVNMVGRTLGFSGLGMAASIPATMIATEGARRFAMGHEQQMMSQNILRQTFGERNMGGAMGIGVSRNGAAQFTDMFRQLASSSEMLTNNQELNNLFKKFNDMELGKMGRSVGDVASRFKKMAETVRDMSKDLGTTLEGVMPTLQRQLDMGFMDPLAIRRSALKTRALKSVGVGVSEEGAYGLQTSQAAANFGAGGSKEIGATGAQDNMALISVALQRGLITEKDLMRATGERGERGMLDLTQQFMQGTRDIITNTGAGRLMSAFLGKVDKEGRFTGEIDENALRQLRTTSKEEIDRIANEKLSAPGGAMSFTARMESGMGADIASQLKGGDVAQVFKMIFEKEGKDGRDAMLLMLKRVGQMRGQTADVMLKLLEQQNGLTEEVDRQFRERSIVARLPAELEERFTLEKKLAKAARSLSRTFGDPITEAGSAVSRGVGTYFDNIGSQIMYNGLFSGLGRGLLGMGIGEQVNAMGADVRTRAVADLINSRDSLGKANTIQDYEALASRVGNSADFRGVSRSRRGGAIFAEDVYGQITGDELSTFMGGNYKFSEAELGTSLQMATSGRNKITGGRAIDIEQRLSSSQSYEDFTAGDAVARGKFGHLGALQAYIQKYGKDESKKYQVQRAAKLLYEGKQKVRAQMEAMITEQTATDVQMSDLGDLFDTSGQGELSRSFSSGLSTYNQIESTHMRAMYEASDFTRMKAINDILMSEEKLNAVLLANDPKARIARAKELTGVELTEADIEEILKFAQTFISKSGSLAKGAAQYKKGVGGQVDAAMRARARADYRARMKIAASDLGGLGAEAMQAFGDTDAGKLYGIIKDKDLGSVDMSEDTRAMLTEFKGIAGKSQEEMAKYLQGLGVDTQGMDVNQMRQAGLRLATARMGNAGLDSKETLQAAAYGNFKEVAEIIQLLRTDTQRGSEEYMKSISGYIKTATEHQLKLKAQLPDHH